jgi:hypothetical protein
MTITPPTRQRRPLAARLALVSTVSLGLVAGPIVLAGPANAAAYPKKDTCTVEAKKPDVHEKKGTKDYGKAVKVVFKFKISCDKGTRVHFDQKLFKETKKGDGKQIRPYSKGWVWVPKNKEIKVEIDKVFPEKNKKQITVYHTVKIVYKNGKGSWKYDFDESKHVDVKFRGYK